MRYFFCSWTYSTCIIVLNWKGNNVLLSTFNSICYLLMRLNIQFFQNMNRWCTKLTRNCETRAGNKLVIAFLIIFQKIFSHPTLKIWNNTYLSSYSHHQNSQGHMYTCKIRLYCYKLHFHDKVGRLCIRQYLRWVETKPMYLTVFLNVCISPTSVTIQLTVTFFCDITNIM